MNKIVNSLEEAVSEIEDGAIVAIGGFFSAGVPRLLLNALTRRRVKNLTIASGAGALLGAEDALNELVENGQIGKVIDSYALFRSARKGAAHPFEQQVRSGKIELEVYPLGTLVEKYRAAGAGIPAFFVPTGAGTMMEETIVTNVAARRAERETRMIYDQKYILEYALKPDFALIHAHMGDTEGNLVYRKTARNLNPVMAMAAKVTIAEVENLVSPGELNPDAVHTPGIFVQRIVQVPRIAFDLANI